MPTLSMGKAIHKRQVLLNMMGEICMKYIALLRGINVGGKNRVPMNQLKQCLEKAGFQNVMTYINSGNVIFDYQAQDPPVLIKKCKEILEEEFKFPIDLALIDKESMREAIEHAPDWWGEDPNAKHNALFVIHPATAIDIVAEVGSTKPEYEQVFAYGPVIFWSALLKTFSRTRWSKIVGTKVYKSVTIRNANTTRKVLEIALSH